MRVTDNLRFESFKRSVTNLKERLDKNQEKISSQKKILTPADDPVGAGQYVQLTAQKNKNDQYTKSLNQLTSLAGTYETAVNGISDVLNRAKQLAVNMSSDTVDATTRKTAASAVEGMIQELVILGNTKAGNSYVFGGMKSDSAAFTLDSTTYGVTFNGTTDVPRVAVAAGQTENLGMSGQTAFGTGTSSDIFAALKGLRDGLLANDKNAIKGSLDTIGAGVDLTANNLSYMGTYSTRIEDLTQNVSNSNLLLETNMSQIMDVDMVGALTDYNLLTTAYETALTVMGKLQSTNILNYLK